MTDQPERLSTDELPPGCPAWAGALFGELALESDLTSYRVVEVLGLLEATRESLTGGAMSATLVAETPASPSKHPFHADRPWLATYLEIFHYRQVDSTPEGWSGPSARQHLGPAPTSQGRLTVRRATIRRWFCLPCTLVGQSAGFGPTAVQVTAVFKG